MRPRPDLADGPTRTAIREDLCEQLGRFSDGELPPDQADEFREHLAGCQHCQRGLMRITQLEALLEEAAVRWVEPKREPNPILAFLKKRKFGLLIPVTALAAAVLAPQCLGMLDKTSGMAIGNERPIDARVTLAVADTYRPFNPKMGTKSAGAEQADVPLSVAGRLDEHGEYHKLATLFLLHGQNDLAASYLKKLRSSGSAPADIDSDQAVVALGQGHYCLLYTSDAADE